MRNGEFGDMTDEQLKQLQPERVWYFFEQLCKIPHGSGHTGQISRYLQEFAKCRNLEYIAEPCGNVIIRKPATAGFEAAPGVVLQGHMDMVTVKEPGCPVDLLTCGPDTDITEDGRYVYAKGTTLGGDDGIALAYGLAILDSDDIVHPAFELVATIDEETGMDGAAALEAAHVQGRRWLNLDSEEEGILLVGCAGGLTQKSVFSLTTGNRKGRFFRIAAEGCRGGHSGTEIDKNRANAILLLGQMLSGLRAAADIFAVSMQGGEKDNAIPTSAEAVIGVCEGEAEAVREAASVAAASICSAYAMKEPKLRFVVTELPDTELPAWDAHCLDGVLNFLTTVPFGVESMSVEPAGLVETSNNVGILRTEGSEVIIDSSVRSLVSYKKELLGDRIATLTRLCGGTAVRHSAYPGWEYRENSALRLIWIEEYRKQYGCEPVVQTIHAGLECGLIIEKMPDADAVSFGPNILDIHTPAERMEIDSVRRTWELLLGILRRLAETKRPEA